MKKVRFDSLFMIASLILFTLFIADYELQYTGVKLIIKLMAFAAIFHFSNNNVTMDSYTRSAFLWAIAIFAGIGITTCCAIMPTHQEDGLYDFESHVYRIGYIVAILFAIYLPQLLKDEYEQKGSKKN